MASFKDCDECTRVSNNKSFNCPPRMSDGRHFTDYRPRCYGQYMVKIDNNIPSSFDYRMYLTRNASDIMKKNAFDAYSTNKCGPCAEPYDEGTMLPEQSKEQCNARTCTFTKNDPYGIGLGRQYYDKEEEQKFRADFVKAKERENDYFKNNANCCTTQADDLQYYPIDGNVKTHYERYSTPGGGMPLSGGDFLKA